MQGWYFAVTDRKLRYGDGRVAKVGVTHRVKGKPECCFHGLHASARALDALRLGAGPVAFQVTLSGEMDHSDDKSAAQARTYDRGGIDITNTLIEFACCAAMGAMLLAEHGDERSWTAIEAALAWTRGEISREELAAAAAAAYAAAYAAAAAAYAAYAAAAAAGYAADAAAAAAYAAAYAAAAYAAYAADASDELNALLEQMIVEEWERRDR